MAQWYVTPSQSDGTAVRPPQRDGITVYYTIIMRRHHVDGTIVNMLDHHKVTALQLVYVLPSQRDGITQTTTTLRQHADHHNVTAPRRSSQRDGTTQTITTLRHHADHHNVTAPRRPSQRYGTTQTTTTRYKKLVTHVESHANAASLLKRAENSAI